jgi:2-polyprenyl-3-methyl-5-hydroxy-6-metoxy-1,4-benzoquinol methylase
MSTDKDWEKWGATDPYFGVLSNEKFRKDGLSESTKKEFFATGVAHVEKVFQLIKDNFNQECKPKRALDFGCGVGRIALPLAERTEQTLGVDVSQSMLAEATSNAMSAGISNIDFVLSDDDLAKIEGDFDLIHSYIVLQHISWSRGRTLLQQLAGKVSPDGYLAVHLLASSTVPILVRAAVRLRYLVPPLNWLRNIFKHRSIFEPAMQLHIYDVDKIVSDLKARGFGEPIFCNEPSMDGFQEVFLLAQRMQPFSTIGQKN